MPQYFVCDIRCSTSILKGSRAALWIASQLLSAPCSPIIKVVECVWKILYAFMGKLPSPSQIMEGTCFVKKTTAVALE